jgi:hypothetical protein
MRQQDGSGRALDLAKETEDTIYVHVQEGLRSVCVGREQGSFPIKTLALDVGQTRPSRAILE